jgi:hypothetical protein
MIIELLDGSDPIDASLLQEARANLAWFNRAMDKYELDRLLSGPYDQRGARLTITAGAGGTDAQVRVGLQQYTHNKLDLGCSHHLVGFKVGSHESYQKKETFQPIQTRESGAIVMFQMSLAVVRSLLVCASHQALHNLTLAVVAGPG